MAFAVLEFAFPRRWVASLAASPQHWSWVPAAVRDSVAGGRVAAQPYALGATGCAMLPTSRSKALAQVVDDLEQATAGSDPVLVRIELSDGSEVQGELTAASHGRLTVAVAQHTDLRDIPLDMIRSVRVAAPARARTWLLVTATVLGGAVSVIAVSAIPGLMLERTAQRVAIVAVGGELVASIGLFRNRSRRWLTRWDLWFSAGSA